MCQSKEDKEMSNILERCVDKGTETNRPLFEKLSARGQQAKFSDDGVLLLDRNNPSHREWYYEDNEE